MAVVVFVRWYDLKHERPRCLGPYGVTKPQWVKLTQLCFMVGSSHRRQRWQSIRVQINLNTVHHKANRNWPGSRLSYLYLPGGGAEDRSTNNGTLTRIPAEPRHMASRFEMPRSNWTVTNGIVVFRLTIKWNALDDPVAQSPRWLVVCLQGVPLGEKPWA